MTFDLYGTPAPKQAPASMLRPKIGELYWVDRYSDGCWWAATTNKMIPFRNHYSAELEAIGITRENVSPGRRMGMADWWWRFDPTVASEERVEEVIAAIKKDKARRVREENKLARERARARAGK